MAFGAAKGAKGPPPGPVLWLLTRLHPGMRARIRTTERAFADKLWRQDLARWDEQDKPAALAKHQALLAIDLTTLSDDALSQHLAAVVDHVAEMVALHHHYTVTCILPVGDLLMHVSDWTGEAPGAILAMLRGTTPISRGILAGELDALASALRGRREPSAVKRAQQIVALGATAVGEVVDDMSVFQGEAR